MTHESTVSGCTIAKLVPVPSGYPASRSRGSIREEYPTGGPCRRTRVLRLGQLHGAVVDPDDDVRVERGDFHGPVQLKLTGLPAGVTAAPEQLFIGAGQGRLGLKLSAARDAPPAGPTKVVVTAYVANHQAGGALTVEVKASPPPPPPS